jgi:hypothetical protein
MNIFDGSALKIETAAHGKDRVYELRTSDSIHCSYQASGYNLITGK